jgi:hypothetical protein
MLKFLKHRIRRFAPSPVRVLDKFPHSERFFSPYSKNLSPCDKSSNQSINMLSLASSRMGRIADFWLFFALMLLNKPHSERFFTVRGEKYLSVRELVQDTCRARRKAANPILFEF